ncbi:DUF2634 domain-containing protein [Peribacillus loiseleuriae]|uniref:DUF2634 domain-containing protein n=1 Tax=Peribacillus loiseleuriae TaxID=1679170 RepID=UPI003D008D12
MLPKITELEFNTEDINEDLPTIGKSFLYDFNKGDFVLKDGKPVELHGIESLKMWINKVIRTEKFKFRIYDNTEYAMTLEDLMGSNFPQAFIEVEIKREVTSSLLLHPYIKSVDGWTFVRDGTQMKIQFGVTTVEGVFEMEVSL